MICSISKAQTDSVSEAPATPAEERAARHLRVLARLTEIQMEMVEVIRTEAVEAPQPGVDYGRRIAVIARSVRQTLLLEERMAGRRDERRKAEAGQAAAADRSRSRLRVTMAMGAAVLADDKIEQDEADRRFREMAERLERPELAELIEAWPPVVAVARLCRMFGLPAEAERWLELGDAGLAQAAIKLSDDPAPDRAEPPDQATIRRRLRVIMALAAGIRAGAGDKDEYKRRFGEMAEQMDRPELAEISDTCPAVEAVARLCPRFGLPAEEAERWVAASDDFLAGMNLPPVDAPPKPRPAKGRRRKPPDTG